MGKVMDEALRVEGAAARPTHVGHGLGRIRRGGEVQCLELEIGSIHPTYLKPCGKIERLWAASSAQR